MKDKSIDALKIIYRRFYEGNKERLEELEKARMDDAAENDKINGQARLEDLLLEGLNSGEGQEVTPEYFQKLKSDYIVRAEKNN
jgi:hypothetical protein